MRQITQLALAAALAASGGAAHAFDGDRRGFMIGVGGGFHTSDIDARRSGFPESSSSESGFQFRLTIGGGVSDQVTVYGLYDIQQDGDAVYGLLGPGATFYFSGAGPSAYVFGAAGVGILSIDNAERSGANSNYRDEYDAATGLGLVFGGGYAFWQGFHLDGSLMYLDLTDEVYYFSDIDYETTSLRITLGYTWF